MFGGCEVKGGAIVVEVERVRIVDRAKRAHAAERIWPPSVDGPPPDVDTETLHLRLTLLQGKYHQVKRMVAAVGNRVEGLHRSSIGRLALPEDLPVGQWCWVEDVAVVLP